jgi:hypothetical protein
VKLRAIESWGGGVKLRVFEDQGGISNRLVVRRGFVKFPPKLNMSRYYKFKGKIQFTPLKFQRFFNLNSKVLKLAVYSLEVSKSGNLNLPLKWMEIKKK